MTDQIVDSVAECKFFGADAVSEVQDIATAILKCQGADVIGSILKRLRNDQKLRALLVKFENAPNSLTDGDD